MKNHAEITRKDLLKIIKEKEEEVRAQYEQSLVSLCLMFKVDKKYYSKLEQIKETAVKLAIGADIYFTDEIRKYMIEINLFPADMPSIKRDH